MDIDFYVLLGVERTASDDELKKAYRRMARELHPDANPGDAEAEERFKQVTLAYEVLRDPERRQRYDTYGIDGVRGAGGGGSDASGFADMGLGDLFDAFFGGGSPFGGGRRRQQSGPPPGSDMESSVRLDFEQSIFGGETEVSLRLPVVCETCSGSGAAPGSQPIVCTGCGGQGEVRRVRQSILGQMVSASTCGRCQGTGQEVTSVCFDCHGEGRRTLERTYTVEVPAGIAAGQTLRLTGKGAAGPRGGASGDLYIHIDVKPHEIFERDEYDLVHEMHVSMTQAALGARIDLEALDGPVEVFVDPGTQTGKLFSFRDRGVPYVNGRGRGNLIIRIFVDTPTKLTKEQEDLVRLLAEQRGESVADSDNSLLGKIKGAFK